MFDKIANKVFPAHWKLRGFLVPMLIGMILLCVFFGIFDIQHTKVVVFN